LKTEFFTRTPWKSEVEKFAEIFICGKMYHPVVLGGVVVSVFATGPKFRGFDPGRGRWIFKGDKNPEHHFLLRGSKAVGPMS
jgi:hypothetical protein